MRPRWQEPTRPPPKPRAVPMRVEPKTCFANERTFLSWLHMAVLIGSIGWEELPPTSSTTLWNPVS